MLVTVNGREQEIATQTLHSLILSLDLDPSVIMAELNGAVIPGAKFTSTDLHDGDTLELLSFVGGG